MNEGLESAQERESTLSFLKRLARKRSTAERCELCSASLSPEHQHLLDPKKRQIVCSCDGCAVLFCAQSEAHYRRIPRRIRTLSDFQMAELQWEALMIPINLAFFYRESATDKMVAMYPSPAGAIESLLSLDAWNEIAMKHPALQTLEPDVETFLVNRVSPPAQHYIVPIDECFRLVGLIRLHWRGLSGGAEVWQEINRFFGDLKLRSTEIMEPARA
jgi:hypothetical protein